MKVDLPIQGCGVDFDANLMLLDDQRPLPDRSCGHGQLFLPLPQGYSCPMRKRLTSLCILRAVLGMPAQIEVVVRCGRQRVGECFAGVAACFMTTCSTSSEPGTRIAEFIPLFSGQDHCGPRLPFPR